MPREVYYIECGCNKGKLETIAYTGVSFGLGMYEDGYSTYFYGCDTCDKIFTRRLCTAGYPGGPDTWRNFEEYKGGLTRDQIKEYVSKERGEFGNIMEARILEKIKNSK